MRETLLLTGCSLFSLTHKLGLPPASVLEPVPPVLLLPISQGDARRMVFIVQKKCFYSPISTAVSGAPLWPIVSLPTLVSVFTQFLVFLLK